MAPLKLTRTDRALCDRIAPKSKLLDALLMLAEPEDRDGVKAALRGIYALKVVVMSQCGQTTETEEGKALSKRYSALKRELKDKLKFFLERDDLVLRCWSSLDAEPYFLPQETVPIIELDVRKSQITLPDAETVNVRVYHARHAPGVRQLDAVVTSSSIP